MYLHFKPYILYKQLMEYVEVQRQPASLLIHVTITEQQYSNSPIAHSCHALGYDRPNYVGTEGYPSKDVTAIRSRYGICSNNHATTHNYFIIPQALRHHYLLKHNLQRYCLQLSCTFLCTFYIECYSKAYVDMAF